MNGQKYGVSCVIGTLDYDVLWTTEAAESDQTIVNAYSRAIGTSSTKFTLQNRGSDVLGSTVRGYWTNAANTDQYSCIWEYNQYPVALAIHGTDTTAVGDACRRAQFYDNTKMARNIG
jgi:hypothetical protein